MTDTNPVKMLHSNISLEYERPLTLAARMYVEGIKQKRLIAHKCKECGRLYTPPRGYCPICVVPTGAEDQVDLPDHGVLVTFTVIKPDPKVQKSLTARTVRGTIMLDGTPITMTGEIKGLEPEKVHTGIHMRAIWADQLSEEDAAVLRGGWGTVGIDGWEATGQPDAPAEEVQRLLSEAGEA